jgi:hypothetical protein
MVAKINSDQAATHSHDIHFFSRGGFSSIDVGLPAFSYCFQFYGKNAGCVNVVA